MPAFEIAAAVIGIIGFTVQVIKVIEDWPNSPTKRKLHEWWSQLHHTYGAKFANMQLATPTDLATLYGRLQKLSATFEAGNGSAMLLDDFEEAIQRSIHRLDKLCKELDAKKDLIPKPIQRTEGFCTGNITVAAGYTSLTCECHSRWDWQYVYWAPAGAEAVALDPRILVRSHRTGLGSLHCPVEDCRVETGRRWGALGTHVSEQHAWSDVQKFRYQQA